MIRVYGFPVLAYFREDKIGQLCSVMGVQWLHDPDRAYELTTDNVKKILAIHMRFRYALVIIYFSEQAILRFAHGGINLSNSVHKVYDGATNLTCKPPMPSLHF